MILHLLQCNYVSLSDTKYIPFDFLITGVFLSLVFSLYCTAAIYLRIERTGWSFFRLLSFSIGLLLIAAAVCPPMMEYDGRSFKGHMMQHLLLGMIAPVALVNGAPITLLLKSLDPLRARRITKILHLRFFRVLTHPVTGMLLSVGSMYVLYLTPLYNRVSSLPSIHYFIHLHFFASGYLFTWSIIGPDPAPHRPKWKFRLAVLFISIAAHSYLSKLMYAGLYPRYSAYTSLDIQEGARLMYYGGDIVELVMIVLLFRIWYKKRNPRLNSGESARIRLAMEWMK